MEKVGQFTLYRTENIDRKVRFQYFGKKTLLLDLELKIM